jgi:hypothetical protein
MMGFVHRGTRLRRAISLSTVLLLVGSMNSPAQSSRVQRSFEILTHRMNVDVDGSPRAYGPPGSDTLDDLRHAHSMGDPNAPIVG